MDKNDARLFKPTRIALRLMMLVFLHVGTDRDALVRSCPKLLKYRAVKTRWGVLGLKQLSLMPFIDNRQ
jgi:hypothetical protein